MNGHLVIKLNVNATRYNALFHSNLLTLGKGKTPFVYKRECSYLSKKNKPPLSSKNFDNERVNFLKHTPDCISCFGVLREFE